MDHLILNNGSDSAALAEVALKALREARNSKTSNSGSIFVSDGQTDDDGIALGTGTIINGVDGGIQPWVGDTTPPGKPTGLSVSSKNAAVIVNWDGSMEGGKPLDWGHLQLLAKDDKGNNYDFGVLYGAGSQQLADLTPDVKLTVWAVGYDDAHDAQGKSTPNASTPSDSLTVTVDSAVNPKDVEKAQSDAQDALNQAGQAKSTANIALANAQEFVVNGGFETGDLTGWTASGVAVLSGWDQDYPHSGNYQARFTAGASCSQSINGLVSGHVIRCSFWQRGFKGRTATMTISFNGGDEQTVGSITGVMPYTRAFKDFTVPANTTTATIKLTCDSNYIRFDDISVKDITEVQAAQATADGKNKIFSSASEPSHTGIVPGDMWFQLDSNKNVSGIQVWNGSTFTDMVLLGNKLLVASSVGTTQIADNAIVTGKIAANAVTAIKIAAQTITGDKLDVGSVAAAIVTSGKFQTATSGARVVVDSNGISAYDSSNALTFQIDAANGDVTSNGGTFTGATVRTNDMTGMTMTRWLSNWWSEMLQDNSHVATNMLTGTSNMAIGATGTNDNRMFRASGTGTIENWNAPAVGINGVTQGVHMKVGSGATQAGVAQDSLTLDPGSYVLSVWVKANNGVGIIIQGAWDATNSIAYGRTPYTGNGNWTQCTSQFTITTKGQYNVSYLYNSTTAGTAGDVYVCAPMLLKSSDWTAISEISPSVKWFDGQNGGTITGTKMDSKGMTIYNSGVAYSHLGSDTMYGLQTWNPFVGSMTDVSLMSFGAASVVETNEVTTERVTVKPNTNKWTPWKDLSAIQENGSWKRFRSPSGRFFVALVMGYNGTPAEDFIYVCGHINFHKNNGGLSAVNDYPSTHAIPGAGWAAGVFTPTPFVGLITVEPNVDYAINFSFKTNHMNVKTSDINAYGHCNYRRLFIMPV